MGSRELGWWQLYHIFYSLLIIQTVVKCDICPGPICEFTLVISHARTMVYKEDQAGAYSVELNGTRLQIAENSYRRRPDPMIGREVNASDVITADGLPRNIYVINGKFPGPALEVVEGSKVTVSGFIILIYLSSELSLLFMEPIIASYDHPGCFKIVFLFIMWRSYKVNRFVH